LIIGVDTDVLVNGLMDGAPNHDAARHFLRVATVERGHQLGLAAQSMHELIHICTDPRRFENPLSMDEAVRYSRALWDGAEVVRLLPSATVFHRTLELLTSLKLGRKRILDTALAATLEAASVGQLATFNARDFEAFDFLNVIVPEIETPDV
jgi:predicted nucleic acid-binding protein